MTLLEIVQKIIYEREFEITSIHGFFGIKKGTNIKLEERFSHEKFSELFNKICETLGNPIYIHSYYGFMWEKDGNFLAYNAIEEYCQNEAIHFFIFDKLPRGKKLKYQYYTQIVETVKQIFANQNLFFADIIHYYNKNFCFLAENNKTRCILMIKRYSLFFGYSQKEPLEDGTVKMTPRYTRKKKMLFDDVAVIKREVESCFIVE